MEYIIFAYLIGGLYLIGKMYGMSENDEDDDPDNFNAKDYIIAFILWPLVAGIVSETE